MSSSLMLCEKMLLYAKLKFDSVCEDEERGHLLLRKVGEEEEEAIYQL